MMDGTQKAAELESHFSCEGSAMCRSADEQMQAFKVQANSLAGYAWQAASESILVAGCVGGLVGFFEDCNI